MITAGGKEHADADSQCTKSGPHDSSRRTLRRNRSYLTTVAFVLKYSSPMYSIGTIGLWGWSLEEGKWGEKREKEEKKKMEASQHGGGKDASVLVRGTASIVLAFHHITEKCKQPTRRQHQPVTCKHPQKHEVSSIGGYTV